jgi:two-component system OmpR family response regulator
MRNTQNILIIEDDPDIAQMLALNLRSEGFAVTVAADGEAGLAHLSQAPCELLLLDLMLPGIDGLQVCRQVRSQRDYLPIIILSAKSAEAHRVLGLELGADDYLVKPFSLPELVARVHAVLRRMEAARQLAQNIAGVIRHGALQIDPVAREALLNGREVVLTTREFDLLLFFARNPGRVYKRMELLDQVWGYSHDGYEHTVNSHINRLRAKIEAKPAQPAYILTVWGVGYKFVEPGAVA